jgi:peptide deformylase
MAVKITKVPDPVLRKVAQEVSVKDRDTQKTIKDLWDALVHSPVEGVGIASPQISVLKRVFILRKGERGFEAYINPSITWASEEVGAGKDSKGGVFLEGCLSIPGIYGPVIRPLAIKVSYYNKQGSLVEELLKEPYSRYFQHELDHLNGVLFIDHVIRQKGKLYEVSEEEELVEIELTR